MTKEILKTYTPKSALLKKYIACYYFHSSDEEVNKKFMYYPNTQNAITIYKNAKIIFNDNYSKSIIDKTIDYTVIYTCNYKTMGIAEIEAPFVKIGILFH